MGRCRGYEFLFEFTFTKLYPTGRQYPFRLGVKFNDNEEISGTAPNANDKALVPGGILGFKLEWYQGSC